MSFNGNFETTRNAFYAGGKLVMNDTEWNFVTSPFRSDYHEIYHEEVKTKTNCLYSVLLKYFLNNNANTNKYFFRNLNAPDSSFDTNYNFNYHLFRPEGKEKLDSVILLLHGLNERNWDKYLPWVREISNKTGKAVLMFPLAFHMERAPKEWSNPRLMFEVCKERMALLPGLTESSFANVALSTRLQFAPERFLVSGLQTLNDLTKLIMEIKSGNNAHIKSNAVIDFFGYSIGSFLGEILLMSDPSGQLSDSRLFVFCGGSTLDNTDPVSKAIMDSQASESMNDYYNNFDENIKREEALSDLVSKLDSIGAAFRMMVNSGNLRSFRDMLFHELKSRLMVVNLLQDRVFHPEGTKLTYTGKSADCVKMTDFPYQYSHENPFPVSAKDKEQVDKSFEGVFSMAGAFLM